MPDRMPEDMPDRMPEDTPEHMPEDMPDRMPDRMPEDMSDRMPEDLSVRKCINVMVGITRSKVVYYISIFFNIYIYIHIHFTTHGISIKLPFRFFYCLICPQQRQPWSSRRPVSAHRGGDF